MLQRWEDVFISVPIFVTILLLMWGIAKCIQLLDMCITCKKTKKQSNVLICKIRQKKLGVSDQTISAENSGCPI